MVRFRVALLIVVVVLGGAAHAHAQAEFDTISVFGANGPANPSLLQKGPDGNLYGIAQISVAGLYPDWVIFRMTPSGEVSIVRRQTRADGAEPSALVAASDGSFYYSTNLGDRKGVFRVWPDGALAQICSWSSSQPRGPAEVWVRRVGSASTYQAWSSTGQILINP